MPQRRKGRMRAVPRGVMGLRAIVRSGLCTRAPWLEIPPANVRNIKPKRTPATHDIGDLVAEAGRGEASTTAEVEDLRAWLDRHAFRWDGLESRQPCTPQAHLW